jgi:hypothetical protein
MAVVNVGPSRYLIAWMMDELTPRISKVESRSAGETDLIDEP